MKTPPDNKLSRSQAISVALEYDAESGSAPLVSATGRAEVSKQIRRVARRYGVPLIQDDALAESLASIDLEQEIPAELYESVARILYDIEED